VTGVSLTALRGASAVVLLDASGVGTVTHHLGTTPSGIVATNGDYNANPGFPQIISKNATTFTFNGGFATPSANFRIDYIAFAQ
jgi:hypothetical protein